MNEKRLENRRAQDLQVIEQEIEEYGRSYHCPSCTREDCIHRDTLRRMPRTIGGQDLCPGHMMDKEV